MLGEIQQWAANNWSSMPLDEALGFFDLAA